MTFLFLLLLRPALKAAEGSRNALHLMAIVIAYPLDVLIAHTAWALIAGWPKKGEWTVSDTLNRLCHQDDERQHFYIAVAKEVNKLSKGHIKGV